MRRPASWTKAIPSSILWQPALPTQRCHRGAVHYSPRYHFYLFACFDACCQGVNSTYNVRVGRAETITGPYLDRDGKAMLEGGGTLILSAYARWIGPGHKGIYQEGDTTWFVYHAYDAKGAGISKLRIESLGWDEAGWPYLPSQRK